MEKEQLNVILINHVHWLLQDCNGWKNMRADLRNTDLRGADLYDADLRGADLRGAHLCGANLLGADLYNADLRCASLYGANLRNIDLYDADLRSADLRNVDLLGADLRGANLRNVDLRGAINVPFIPYACPDQGAFIGWKKANNKIVCIEVSADAKRSSATGRKCRCNKAKVISIEELDGTKCDLTEIASSYDKNFIYKVNEEVSVNDFNENRWEECATGIHFFINRQEAVDYKS